MPKPTKKTNTGRWKEILDGAAEAFFEKGYDGTSIQDVADRVGLLKGSLYHYIKTKEDLLFAILQDVMDEGLAVLERAREHPGDVRSQTRAFVRAYTEFTIVQRVRAALFDHDFRSFSPERKRHLVGQRDVYDLFLRGLLAEGIRNGTFAPDLDAVIIGNVIFQMINSTYHWYSPEGSRSIDEIAEQIADFVDRGLLAQPA